MDYFNIRWPKTISQKGSKEAAPAAFLEGEIVGAFKVEARIARHWMGKDREEGPADMWG